MRTFEGLADAATQLNQWYWQTGRALFPAELQEQIEAYLGPTRSAVEAVVRVSEIVYARRAELPPEVLEFTSGLPLVAEEHGFHGMDEGSRGSKMSLVMRRDSGEKAATGRPWPKAKNDPEPKGEYAPPGPPVTPEVLRPE